MMDAQFFNGLTEGDFGTGFLAIQSLVEGDFWVLTSGLNTLYRGDGAVGRIDYSSIVYASANDGAVALPSHLSHAVASETFYSLRKVSGTGKQEKGSMSLVKLALDGARYRKLPQPNVVRYLQADTISGGLVRVSWWYGPLGQEALPKQFEVYGDGGSGVVDYGTALATVDYIGGGMYSADVAGGSDGQRLLFGVRGVTAAGMDDENLATVERVEDRDVPDGVVVVRCETAW